MVRLTCLASCTTVGLLLFVTEPAFAEFQIQEAGIEKGEVELEYRGAYHWGVPQVTDTNENANDLVQSHEFELQMGVTDWWLLSVTAGLDQPLGENLQGSAVEVETEFALLKRRGDGIALSFQTGYEQAFNHGAQVDGDPNQFGAKPAPLRSRLSQEQFPTKNSSARRVVAVFAKPARQRLVAP
jgi:hypothetical protein